MCATDDALYWTDNRQAGEVVWKYVLFFWW